MKVAPICFMNMLAIIWYTGYRAAKNWHTCPSMICSNWICLTFLDMTYICDLSMFGTLQLHKPLFTLMLSIRQKHVIPPFTKANYFMEHLLDLERHMNNKLIHISLRDNTYWGDISRYKCQPIHIYIIYIILDFEVHDKRHSI